ncbi:MAG: FGGY family carbohydrate kinase [Actinomycetes bacterium]|jgi:glycerol kinase
MAASAHLVLSIDQGTSATKTLLLDPSAKIISRGEHSISQSNPANGWVEQDANEIEASIYQAIEQALLKYKISDLAVMGISNQRESVLLWDKESGEAISPVISWQDSRTADICKVIAESGARDRVEELSGLPLDPMFSAPKIRWLLDKFDPTREMSASGALAVGTIDSWLTRGRGNHSIEIGNASRTQLLDIQSGQWSEELLSIFNIPMEVLPDVRPSNFLTYLHSEGALGSIPVQAILGDSHAALYGHGIQLPGRAKVTYGTGSSVMSLTSSVAKSNSGICRTIAWSIGNDITHAVEGNIRSAGATLKWLSQITSLDVSTLVSLSENAKETGLQIIPAFNGLGAPWWDSQARGMLTGLTLADGPAEFARAAIESIALQVCDVVVAMNSIGSEISSLDVDGGASANDGLMQLQSDLLQMQVNRPQSSDYSALGVAYMAGIEAKVWGRDVLENVNTQIFSPKKTISEAEKLISQWKKSLSLARH